MTPRDYTFQRRHLRLAAGLALVAASAILLLWGFWPERRSVRVLHLDSALTSLEAPDVAVRPVGTLRLEYPEMIRLNDRALVRLAFEVVTDQAAVPPIAEARLEVPGALVRPPDSIHEALAPDKPLEFYWTVALNAPGEYRGTAWSFLTTQAESSAPSSRVALGAQTVEMKSIALLGMSGEAARIVGGLSLIGGFVLWLPFVEPAARWISRRGARGV